MESPGRPMRAATEPTSFGPYTLIRRLGVGGMAEVHVGTIERAGRFLKPVALKRVHPDIAADPALSATLIAEAKLSARLDHRNIVQTFDLDRVDDTLILVMEYVQGLDLGRLTERLWQHQVSFPIDLAVRVAERACRALEYAHALTDEQGVPLGLVHRDVSPQNVLVSQAGEVKLADFGIARTRTRVSDPDAGVIKGKHLYMSPEQACGEALDARSDSVLPRRRLVGIARRATAACAAASAAPARGGSLPPDSCSVGAASRGAPSARRSHCPRHGDRPVGAVSRCRSLRDGARSIAADPCALAGPRHGPWGSGATSARCRKSPS